MPQLLVGDFPGGVQCAATTSWDDNNELDMEIMEQLDACRLKGTFYIDPGTPVKNGLSIAQLGILAQNHEVCSHSWSHKNLTMCDSTEVVRELLEAKKYLEMITDKPVLGLAYPFGRYSRDVEENVQECGYWYARAVHEGTLKFPPSDRYAWEVTVAVGRTARLLSRRFPFYIKNLTNRWPSLAMKLFDQARSAGGVWHMFGHAYELESRKTRDALVEIFSRVAHHSDVWYATNGMLFVNEMLKQNARITRADEGNRAIFKVQTKVPPEVSAADYPLPLRLIVPDDWTRGASVEVNGDIRTTFEARRRIYCFDVLGKDTEILVTQA
jgi:peptidoglycan/xylan/chitin deacetylase (PgdA/CDA1 family)